MRLTRKDGITYFMFDRNGNWKRSVEITKLGQLEDLMEKYNIDNANDLDLEIRVNRDKVYKYESIEKKLGIDLGILGKALLQGDIYVKEYCQYFKFYISGNHLYIQLQYGMGMSLNLKDYGKTWALTKEELL